MFRLGPSLSRSRRFALPERRSLPGGRCALLLGLLALLQSPGCTLKGQPDEPGAFGGLQSPEAPPSSGDGVDVTTGSEPGGGLVGSGDPSTGVPPALTEQPVQGEPDAGASLSSRATSQAVPAADAGTADAGTADAGELGSPSSAGPRPDAHRQ